MKKLATKIAMVAAFAAVAGYGVYASQKKEATLSDTALANVEALARNEATITCSRSCSDGIGRCWIRSNSGYCAFTGYQSDNCRC